MNDIGTGIILAIVGAIIGFFGARFLLNIQRKNKTNELNAQVDLEVKEARLNAKRIMDEAELKAEKLLDQSEVKNERIKQRKIQEAKDNFNSLKSQFESHKASQMIESYSFQFQFIF
jgi:ribonuclease Y